MLFFFLFFSVCVGRRFGSGHTHIYTYIHIHTWDSQCTLTVILFMTAGGTSFLAIHRYAPICFLLTRVRLRKRPSTWSTVAGKFGTLSINYSILLYHVGRVIFIYIIYVSIYLYHLPYLPYFPLFSSHTLTL